MAKRKQNATICLLDWFSLSIAFMRFMLPPSWNVAEKIASLTRQIAACTGSVQSVPT